VIDLRTCTCDCEGAGCIGGSITYYSQAGCTGSSTSKPLEDCYYGPLGSFKTSLAPAPKACVPTGASTSSGSLTATGLRTLCCTG
jgi:hypothetical protein